MRYLLILLVVVLLVGCYTSDMDPLPDEELASTVQISRHIWRIVDEQAGVVCYTYYGDSLSCLPIEETRLDD